MVSASTQSQALNALVFWFKQALGKDFGDLGDFQKSKRTHFIPVVLTRAEVGRLLASMEGDTALMAALLYGSGLRLQELRGPRAGYRRSCDGMQVRFSPQELLVRYRFWPVDQSALT